MCRTGTNLRLPLRKMVLQAIHFHRQEHICLLQTADCWISAGYPDSINCLDYLSHCSNVQKYCSAWGAGSSRDGCFKQYPLPSYATPLPPTPTACTTFKSTSSVTSTTTTSVVPVPTVTNICVQPSGDRNSGYDSNSPVGNIQIPVVTCNNVRGDWNNNPFKLYSDKDTFKCGSYSRGNVPQACADACKLQYNSCVGVYAQSCRGNNRRSPDNWGGDNNGDDYNSASNKCYNQYRDCLNVNRSPRTNGCQNFNSW
ncbi:MAG: hypothetical protein M1829_004025 [Trizodia sp. TS-e1964]|nr:MAG: hypothetical protein M1829_004025 [Trizodia sp. TS-e1964]